MDKTVDMLLIFSKLNRESQNYLFSLANMAKVAEGGKERTALEKYIELSSKEIVCL